MAKQMKDPLLSIKNLSVSLEEEVILDNINLSLFKNEILALVGESGSGKSVTAQMIMGLLPTSLRIETNGELHFENQNLLQNTLSDWQAVRGNQISIVFQEPQSSLNPSLRCGPQVEEMGKQHFSPSLNKEELKRKVISAFEKVKLPSPERIYNAFPHELSGGQKQRIMIAMALLCEPQLLIADEPTTALDVLVQKEIIHLIKDIQQENKMSVLFISHDLALVSNIADRIAVMQAGKIVEQGLVAGFFFSKAPLYKRIAQCPSVQ